MTIIINQIFIVIIIALLLLILPEHSHGLACPVKPLHNLLIQTPEESTPTATTDIITTTPDGASALELWTVSRLETMYRDSVQIKCPFFRRRASDLLEGIDMMARFLVIRHKSILDLPLGCRIPSSRPKRKNLDTATILSILSNDWKPSTHKGYYITGRLNQTIYRDDCLFDGPDPDMPVKGLAKYVKASKDLFDYDASCAQLLELKLVDDSNKKVVQARWKLQNCVLRLPWRPMLPTWTGTTTYHLDEDSLIYHHEEAWDLSVLEAFCRTVSPALGDWIWKNSQGRSSAEQQPELMP